ncbi:DUF721 domain-containing protein [Geomonas sp. Red32]|uniref:DUF721 domain-containing protein n=1 Tax=Geomonas sp. Red32 TaxID=2912856 RepID=UPI00202CB1C2|nr:DUF721 domain-containing protein [Geomonas sp. Red32]
MSRNDKRPRMRRPAAVSDLLSTMLKGTPAETRIREGRIWGIWERAVGSRIANHAQPSAFRDGTLTVTVDSAPWMQQLSFLKRELILKVNDALGYTLVKELYFRAGKVVNWAAPAPPAPVRQRRQLAAEEIEEIEEQAKAAGTAELQAIFANLIKKDKENR